MFKNFQVMEETAMKVAQPFSEMQEGIQEMMKSYSPMLEAAAKQSSIVVKALDLPRMEPFYKEMTRITEQASRLREMLAPPSVDFPFLEPITIPGISIPLEFADIETSVIENPTIIKKTKFMSYDETKEEFFCQGNKIIFPLANALYVHVLKELFILGDEEGFCSYGIIDHYLENNGQKHIRSKKLKRKRIHNAIGHLQREKRYKSAAFPLQTPNGSKVIENVREQGFVLNNPIV